MVQHSRAQRTAKRVFDLVVTLVALAVLTPAMLIIALIVRLRLGSPVLFRQTRPGHRGKLFTMLKFRTMTDSTSATGEPLPDEERLTSLGRFLRDTSLDELPEL